MQRGLGKGSPGLTRKSTVTKRQQRRRSKEGLQKRPASERPPASTQPPRKRPAPTPASTQSQSGSCSTSQETASSSQDLQNIGAPDEATETRVQLRMQTRGEAKPIINLIRECAGAVKDNEPNQKELVLFWNLMDNHHLLDDNIARGKLHLNYTLS